MVHAAFSHSSRAWSISLRDSAICCGPRPARPAACRTRSASAPGRPSAPAPARPRRCARMQWWMRPGPSRACAIANPPPSSPSRLADRHPNVVVDDLAVPVLVLPAEHRRRAHDVHPGGVDGHQHHRLLLMAGRVGIGAAHHDQDLAARVGRTRSPPLAAVDDVVVAVAEDRTSRCCGRRWRPPRARSSRTRCGSRRPAAARATACAAPRWRTGAGSPCCRCRARRSWSPRGRAPCSNR